MQLFNERRYACTAADDPIEDGTDPLMI